MPEIQRIVLDIDDAPHREKLARANKDLDNYETRATAAQKHVQAGWDDSGDRAQRSARDTRSAWERSVDAIESRMAAVGKSIGNAFSSAGDQVQQKMDGFFRFVEKAAEIAGVLYLIKEGVERVSSAFRDNFNNTEKLVNSYRGLRIVLSPSMWTVYSVGAGIAFEALVKFAYGQAQAAEKTALAAAEAGVLYRQYDQLQSIADSTGIAIGSLVNAAGRSGGVDAFVAKVNQLKEIADPVKRANAAITAFGSSAGDVFPAMTAKVDMAASSYKNYVSEINNDSRSRLKTRVDDLKDAFGGLWQDIKNQGRDVKGVIVDLTTALSDLLALPFANQKKGDEIKTSLKERGMAWVSSLGGYEPLTQESRQAMEAASKRLNTSATSATQPTSAAYDADVAAMRYEKTLSGMRMQLGAEQAKMGKLIGDQSKLSGALAISGLQAISMSQQRITLLTKEIELEERRLKYYAEGEKLQKRIASLMKGGGLKGSDLEVKPESIANVEALDTRSQAIFARGKEQRDYADETAKIQNETADRQFAAEATLIQRERDQRLAAADATQSRTLAGQVELERAKAGILTDSLDKQAALEAAALNRRMEQETQYLDLLAKLYPERAADIAQRRAAIVESYGQQGADIEAKWVNESAKIRLDSEQRVQSLVYDAWQRQFESLKSSYEGLWDAAFTGGKSFFDRLRRLGESIFLAPIKQQFSTWLANITLPMMGGQVAQGQGGMRGIPSTTGILGSIFGGFGGFGTGTQYPTGTYFPGATPPFWSGGSSGTYTNIPGMVGVGIGGNGQVIYNQQGGSGVGGWAGMLAGGKGMLASLGNLGKGFSASHGGVNGAAGVAMLAGGGILAYDGLRRGGLIGMAETTAGGALIGAKFGGPLGAVIGAGVGALAGFIRLFVKGAEQKTIDKVRDRYGVKIDKPFAKTLLESSKQYGGIDVYLGTAQAREAIWLYAQMTDQKKAVGMVDNQARGVFLEQRGGGLYQGGVYSGGTAYGYQSSLPSIGSLTPMQPQNQTVYVSIQADGQATTSLMQGQSVQFVQSNPRLIGEAVNAATAQNSGRLQSAGQLVDPLGGRL